MDRKRGESSVDGELEADELLGQAVDRRTAQHAALLVEQEAVGRVGVQELCDLVGEPLQHALELEVAGQHLRRAQERALLADPLAVLLEEARHVDREPELVRDRFCQ